MSLDQSDFSENINTLKIFTVEQLNMQIRSLIEGQMGIIWIQAEISNFKPHSSGHFYFSLKDSKSQISAVMFRGHNSKLKFKPQDGLEVIVRARVTVYEPRGSYQLTCESMEPVGAGALQKQFEQLKDKLKSEGLFESSRKKIIPPHPHRIAIVTSPTGAAIQDILNIMNRRAKNVEIIVVPTIVQGAAAAPLICEAFLKAQKLNADVIIIGRGGGSIEDMWCFNDEKLARLISECKIPVISAVGHEIDFTICDFVSDLRAPTPSAAAELVAKSSNEIEQKIIQLNKNLKFSINKTLEIKSKETVYLSRRLSDPKKKLQDLMIKSDDLFDRLENAIQLNIGSLKKDIQILRNKLTSPDQVISRHRLNLDKKNIRLQNLINLNIQKSKYRTHSIAAVLDSLSPLKVLDRGYAITKSKNMIIKSIQQVSEKDIIEVRIQDGFIKAEIINIEKI